jgi:hypothetical protein
MSAHLGPLSSSQSVAICKVPARCQVADNSRTKERVLGWAVSTTCSYERLGRHPLKKATSSVAHFNSSCDDNFPRHLPITIEVLDESSTRSLYWAPGGVAHVPAPLNRMQAHPFHSSPRQALAVCVQGLLLAFISFILGALACHTLRQHDVPLIGGMAASSGIRAAARPPKSRFHQAPCPVPRQPGTKTRNLVFAAVGDKWSPSL